jgi:hypothetical protein
MKTQVRRNSASDKIYNVVNTLQPHNRRTKKIISLFDDGYTFEEIADQIKQSPIKVLDIIYAHLRRTLEVDSGASTIKNSRMAGA